MKTNRMMFRGALGLAMSLSFGCSLLSPAAPKATAGTSSTAGSGATATSGLAAAAAAAGAPTYTPQANHGSLLAHVMGPTASLIANNASGLIANNASGLIANNASGLIANNAGGLIANNAGGLIANNAGGLIANNAGGYFVLDAESDTIPVKHAPAAVFNELGERMSTVTATTDDNGDVTITGIKASGPVLIVKVVYTEADHQVELCAVVNAPREGEMKTNVTPGSTFVGKKVKTAFRLGQTTVEKIQAADLGASSALFDKVLSPQGVVAAAVLPTGQAAQVVDALTRDVNGLGDAIGGGTSKVLLEKVPGVNARSIPHAHYDPVTGKREEDEPKKDQGAANPEELEALLKDADGN